MQVIYEDNHLLIVNKKCGEIVQGDETGDTPLSELAAHYLVKKYNKPGKAFIGVTHRLDRPTSGVVVFAKTSKALSRMNSLFRDGKTQKVYHAIVTTPPQKAEGRLENLLQRNAKKNKSFVVTRSDRTNDSTLKKAVLNYRVVAKSERYSLLEIHLHTGRHHQIRAQLAHIGCYIKGDLKYGAPRSNPDGGISLHAASIRFIHPVSGIEIFAQAPYPDNEPLWKILSQTSD